jgi:hypothetical protein
MADELDHYRQLLMDDRRETHALASEARAALAQPEPQGPTGRPLIEPVPVAERLPGWRDCDKNDCVWVEEPDRYVLRPIEKSDIRQNRRWLPHHALPVPQQEAE